METLAACAAPDRPVVRLHSDAAVAAFIASFPTAPERPAAAAQASAATG